MGRYLLTGASNGSVAGAITSDSTASIAASGLACFWGAAGFDGEVATRSETAEGTGDC